MQEQDWKRWLERRQELSARQRQALMALMAQLNALDERAQVLTQMDQAGASKPNCPRCASQRVVRNGQADGLQRY